MNERQLQSLADHLNQSRQEFVTTLQAFTDVLQSLNDNMKDFRSHLDETLVRERETFDDEYLASGARMVQAQENFTASANAVSDVTIALNNRVQHYDDIFNGIIDMIGSHNESARITLEMFPKFFAAFTETNANTEATNKRLDEIVLKIENYFGSADGLNYDN
jgi:ABC-type transporter Mla subunit MlaD